MAGDGGLLLADVVLEAQGEAGGLAQLMLDPGLDQPLHRCIVKCVEIVASRDGRTEAHTVSPSEES